MTPTRPVTLAELVRLAPLATALGELVDPARRVRSVVLAETFDRLRGVAPHSLVVLHSEAASGGWSLAAALHLAWERNASAVVVSRTVAGASSTALARRLPMSLFLLETDPVDAALQLAGLVSAPHAARALHSARVADQLTDQTSIRSVVGLLNAELDGTAVALVVGDTVLAGRAAAVQERPDTEQVSVEVGSPGERPWGRLVAAVPAHGPAAAEQVRSLLRLARPALVAAWARTRLDVAARAEHEQAAFGLLRKLAADSAASQPLEPRRPAADSDSGEVETPVWAGELGWQVDGWNRALWFTPANPRAQRPDELTQLVRAAWHRGRSGWPLIAEADGWISWHASAERTDSAGLSARLSAVRTIAESYDLVVGIGRAHAGVAGLMRSVSEARLAAQVGRDVGPGTVQSFDQVGPSAALSWLPLDEIVQVAELCLSEVMAAKDRTVLVETVLAVLDCGGSLSQASQRLGVHRNTVLARLTRARQLGVDLDDPALRLPLHVLCHAVATVTAGPATDPVQRNGQLASMP